MDEPDWCSDASPASEQHKHSQRLFVRLWAITTNDNLDALRFYQRQGFRIAKIHMEALKESRRLKPEIPETGLHKIPVRDEIELEKDLH